MKKLFLMCLVGVFAIACSKSGSKDGAQGPHSDEFEKIIEATKAAKKSMDFIKIKTDCGLIESKDPEVTNDPQYNKICRVGLVEARAKLTIQESKPGSPSGNCGFVDMDIESLIEKGIQEEQMKKLLVDVKKACGG